MTTRSELNEGHVLSNFVRTINDVLRTSTVALTACYAIGTSAEAQQSTEQSKVIVDQDGTVHVPVHEVPPSIYMSDGAKRAYINQSLHFDP
jgi:hypothetical protein